MVGCWCGYQSGARCRLASQLTQNVPRTFALGDVFVRTLGTFSEHSANVTVERTKPTFKQRCIQRLANVV